MISGRLIHRKIKQALAILEEDSNNITLNVKTIAKKAEIDVRTVKYHLELLEEDNQGIFCDDEKQTFSTSKYLIEKFGKEK